jgi:hypothetical protein
MKRVAVFNPFHISSRQQNHGWLWGLVNPWVMDVTSLITVQSLEPSIKTIGRGRLWEKCVNTKHSCSCKEIILGCHSHCRSKGVPKKSYNSLQSRWTSCIHSLSGLCALTCESCACGATYSLIATKMRCADIRVFIGLREYYIFAMVLKDVIAKCLET